ITWNRCGQFRARRMSQTFNHPFWKRSVTVDDEGIHEYRRGRHHASVRWEELESLSVSGARGAGGKRVSTLLTRYTGREFGRCASDIWRQRYPDRWRRHFDRSRRNADWVAYFFFPLYFVGLPLLIYF